MDVMSLSKADRERLKALLKVFSFYPFWTMGVFIFNAVTNQAFSFLKLGDKDKLRPLFDKLLGPRISRPPRIPIPPEKLPSSKQRFQEQRQSGCFELSSG